MNVRDSLLQASVCHLASTGQNGNVYTANWVVVIYAAEESVYFFNVVSVCHLLITACFGF